MGTLSVTYLGTGVVDGKRYADVSITPSTSYATGGDTLPLTATPLRRVEEVWQSCNGVGDNSGVTWRLLGTLEAPLLQAFDAQNTQVANATNLSTRVFHARLVGR
jgi:hypothetical protein